MECERLRTFYYGIPLIPHSLNFAYCSGVRIDLASFINLDRTVFGAIGHAILYQEMVHLRRLVSCEVETGQ
jgi:hypothetical protein